MSETAIRFTVPMVPPNLNHYVRHTRTGRHYVTKEATAFKSALAVYARGASVHGKAFDVSLLIVLGAKERLDVDGGIKLCLDGLADCGAFRDLKGNRLSDAHVIRLVVEIDRKDRPEIGRTVITVTNGATEALGR